MSNQRNFIQTLLAIYDDLLDQAVMRGDVLNAMVIQEKIIALEKEAGYGEFVPQLYEPFVPA